MGIHYWSTSSWKYSYSAPITVRTLAIIVCTFMYLFPVSQLGVMTYTDMTAQSPEAQAAVEREVRLLLKVCVTL